MTVALWTRERRRRLPAIILASTRISAKFHRMGIKGANATRLPMLALLMIVGAIPGCIFAKKAPATEPISITSIPAGATAMVPGGTVVTPAKVEVARDKPLTICVSAPGYSAQTVYDDTMVRWKYQHDCFPGQPDCASSTQSDAVPTHLMTKIDVRLHPCDPADGSCLQCRR
jgi:hypothetical protein